MTDELLVTNYVLKHDSISCVLLIKRYERFMNYISYTPIKNFTTNEEEKEELKGELIIVFLENLPLYNQEIGTFKVFIENKIRNYGRNYARKLMKHKNNTQSIPTNDLEKLEALIEEIEEDDATYEYVRELIDRLPPRQQQVAKLRILKNYRFHQIGEELYPNTNPKTRHSTVNKNFQEAVKKLRKWIEE